MSPVLPRGDHYPFPYPPSSTAVLDRVQRPDETKVSRSKPQRGSRPVPPHARFLRDDRGLLGAGRTRIAAKRLVDLVGSMAMLLALAPAMILIALLVRLTSRGPVFFKQERVGYDGQSFQMWKFRTMRADAEDHREALDELNEADGPVFKIRSDPRITGVGRYLRRWSLDELPQFINVMKGEMSLVGPRPPTPSEVETYNVWEMQRLRARPGLTCIWQVSGRSEVDFQTWVEMDVDYIANWSLRRDLNLLARTVPAVLKRDGAY